MQGIIAARLDALSPAEKALLQDAAVVGKVFWLGALAAIGRPRAAELDEPLHALERKEFVRRERRSAVAGETQYAFRHVLVRDVAYGQIPRGRRAEKHRLAAEWIESLASDRSEDRVEMLAHHYLEAISLAKAAGVDASALRAPAATALVEATHRAESLNASPIVLEHGRAALELLPVDDPRRPKVLFAVAWAQWLLDELEPTVAEEARDAFLAAGNVEEAAAAETLLGRLFWIRGDGEGSRAHSRAAFALVEGRPPSPGKARVYAARARNVFIAGNVTDGLEYAHEALPLVEEIGSDELVSHVLTTRGMCRVSLGDPGGIDDLRRSVELADATNLPETILNACNNLANMLWRLGDLDAASEALAHGRASAERFGVKASLRWLLGEDMLSHSLRGEWDEALAIADDIVTAAAETPHYHEGPARMMRSEILLGRGAVEGALADSERGLELAREAGDLQLVGPALLYRARVLYGAGRAAEADGLIREVLDEHDLGDVWLHGLGLLLAELGRGDEYLAAVGEDTSTPWLEAARAAAAGEFQRAAAIFGGFGARFSEAQARLLAARRSPPRDATPKQSPSWRRPSRTSTASEPRRSCAAARHWEEPRRHGARDEPVARLPLRGSRTWFETRPPEPGSAGFAELSRTPCSRP